MVVDSIKFKGVSMVKLYMLLLVGCSLYVNGADPDNREAILKKWGGNTRNLSDLTKHNQALKIYTDSFGKSEDSLVINTPTDQQRVEEVRTQLLGLALTSLKDSHQEAEEIMHLTAKLELALRVYEKRSCTDGPSPRTICLWGGDSR